MSDLITMQEQNELLIETLKSIKNFSGLPDDVKITLRNLQSIEKEWKDIVERLKEREKEYIKLIDEVKTLKLVLEL